MYLALYEKLLQLEREMPMSFAPPATAEDLTVFRQRFPQAPAILYELWAISDGVEINIPGTVLYGVKEALAASAPEDWVPLGRMSFGDPLYLDPDGQVLQIDHEDGSLFLTWPCLLDFLEDEREGVGQ